jgi:hypothetical protein
LKEKTHLKISEAWCRLDIVKVFELPTTVECDRMFDFSTTPGVFAFWLFENPSASPCLLYALCPFGSLHLLGFPGCHPWFPWSVCSLMVQGVYGGRISMLLESQLLW